MMKQSLKCPSFWDSKRRIMIKIDAYIAKVKFGFLG